MSNRLHRADLTGKTPKNGKPETFAQFDAETRRLAREQRTPAQQLAALDARLGVGVGAYKERTRLHVEAAQAKS